MKLKYDFVINEVGGQKVAVPTGAGLEKVNGFIKLNQTGAEIFDLLKHETTRENIVSDMLKKYPQADENKMKESVDSFINALKKREVLQGE